MNEQNKDQNSDSEPQIVSEEPEEILEDLNNDIEEIEKASSEDIIKDKSYAQVNCKWKVNRK